MGINKSMKIMLKFGIYPIFIANFVIFAADVGKHCYFYHHHDQQMNLIDFTWTLISHSFGLLHSCYVNDIGKLKCFGLNLGGQLGLGDTNDRGDKKNEMGKKLPFVEVGNGLSVKLVVCGGYHTCVILNNDNVKCFGSNEYGQLGQGDTDNRGDEPNEMGDNLPVIDLGTSGAKSISIVAGHAHTCILFDNKKVKCFGRGGFGVLGHENGNDIGDEPNEMGDNLSFISFGTNINVLSIFSSSNSWSNCIIIDGSQLMKSWGANYDGQLGYGDTNNRGNNLNTMGDYLPTVELGDEDRVKQIGMGYDYTCIIRYDDVMKCFGGNDKGQLGIGSITDVINTNGNSLVTTKVDSGTKKAKIVKGGFDHTCILLDDLLTVKCVGYNGNGELGQGDTTDRGDQPTNTMDLIPAIDLGTGSLNILDIGAGDGYTCVIFVDYTIKCFGSNGYGQLGSGSVAKIGDKAGNMGKKLRFVDVFGPVPPQLCSYGKKSLCKSDKKCIWKETNGIGKCNFNCLKLKKEIECDNQTGCKWNKISGLCDFN